MTETVAESKIKCELCGGLDHSIQVHLRRSHGGTVTLADYQRQFPNAPLLSEAGVRAVAAERARKEAAAQAQAAVSNAASVSMSAAPAPNANVTQLVLPGSIVKRAMHEVFELGPRAAGAFSVKTGQPLAVTTLVNADTSLAAIPDVDDNHVYDIELLKNILLAIDLKIPVYLWGHTGVGKTSILEQICARTGRPWMRVQHTNGAQEREVVGQRVAFNGETPFMLGALPLAMKHGWVYCADEYDMAMPGVIAIYQSVLEGKSLVIKDANPEDRVIKPHENFRFVATGNTNGTGDETGLYQGTVMQNFANYSRFGMVAQVRYMDKATETKVIAAQAQVAVDDAKRLVEFATLIREAFETKKIGVPIGPRELIYAAKIGLRRMNLRIGVNLSFINKLSTVDRAVAEGLAQRTIA